MARASIFSIDTNVNPLRGVFTETSEGHAFEYCDRDARDRAVFAPDLPHEIYVTPRDTRAARVLKTVVYVAVDEDADGNPVLEKWRIKGHRAYYRPTVRLF